MLLDHARCGALLQNTIAGPDTFRGDLLCKDDMSWIKHKMDTRDWPARRLDDHRIHRLMLGCLETLIFRQEQFSLHSVIPVLCRGETSTSRALPKAPARKPHVVSISVPSTRVCASMGKKTAPPLARQNVAQISVITPPSAITVSVDALRQVPCAGGLTGSKK